AGHCAKGAILQKTRPPSLCAPGGDTPRDRRHPGRRRAERPRSTPADSDTPPGTAAILAAGGRDARAPRPPTPTRPPGTAAILAAGGRDARAPRPPTPTRPPGTAVHSRSQRHSPRMAAIPWAPWRHARV